MGHVINCKLFLQGKSGYSANPQGREGMPHTYETPLSPVFRQLTSSINELLGEAALPVWNGGGFHSGRREVLGKATWQPLASGMGYALVKSIHSKEQVLDVSTEHLVAFCLRQCKSEVHVKNQGTAPAEKKYSRLGKETGYESCHPPSVLKSKNKNFHHLYKLVLFLTKWNYTGIKTKKSEVS